MIQEQTKSFRTAEFGTVPTDHMFVATFENGKWNEGEVMPFGKLHLSPFTACFHYGQMIFEGLKAYKQPDGSTAVFRHKDNFRRLNRSLDRMAMPELPYEIWETGLFELLEREQEWVPDGEGSLYIRPFVIATEERLGVRVSGKYMFLITLCPVSHYYQNPLSVKVETRYARAGKGGVGHAKCAGNYAGSFYPFRQAKEEGYDQVIWTDAATHKFVEESGTMNLAFIIENNLLTPPVSETILDGITRKSVLSLAPECGLTVKEAPVEIEFVLKKIEEGLPVEAAGVGTAAVIAPIKTIGYGGKDYSCYVEEDAKMLQLKKKLMNIQWGLEEDKYNWMTVV